MSLVKVAGNASGTGTLTIQAPNTNTNYTLDLPAAAGTIQLSGNPISGTTGTFSGTISGGSTIGVGGATPSNSGAGITFPATQSASSDANTLDDYEEGTWTPTIEGSGTAGTGTYQQQVGRYTKVGNLVTINAHVEWNAHTGSGNLRMANLPFTILNVSDFYGSASFGYINNIALTANNVALGLGIFNTTFIALYQYPVGGGAMAVVPLDTAGTLIFSMSYQV